MNISKSVANDETETLTHVVMPPPPIPVNARAAISVPIVGASPQNRHPRANTVYAKRRHDFRPNASLSLPYSGLGTL